MLAGKGIFSSYPPEWQGVIPFQNWGAIALITIVLLGLGNVTASIIIFTRKHSKSYQFFLLMGAALLFCIVLQAVMLGEWYLASIELLLLSVIQITLGSFVFRFSKE
ncbi:hypothetical protein [Guptibacillus hwajinpoensis]|uniref:hypothetical protein n=1 Tax=Guptibacillus hwajinpoensis TaxID=208199 RepID=UPI003D013D7B